MPPISLTKLLPKLAIKYLKRKVLITSTEYKKLEDEAKALAYTVSGVTKMDILLDTRDALEKVMGEGGTLDSFKKQLSDIMTKKGWAGISPRRAETVFRTNISTADSVGFYAQTIKKKKSFPYWEYQALDDSRTRFAHFLNDGKIYPINHPFWDIWYPPNGFNCRCGVRPVHKYEVEADNLRIEDKDPTGKRLTVFNPVTGKNETIIMSPDVGFAVNPAKVAYKPDLEKYPRELVEAFKKYANNVK